MKKEDLFDAFDSIDDKYIEEGSKEFKKSKSGRVYLISAAAVAAVVLGILLLVTQTDLFINKNDSSGNNEPLVAEKETGAYSTVSSQTEEVDTDTDIENNIVDYSSNAVYVYDRIKNAVDNDSQNMYSNFAGAYVDNDIVHVLVTDRNTDDEYVRLAGDYRGNIVIEERERSYNELLESLKNTVILLPKDTAYEAVIDARNNNACVNINNYDENALAESLDLKYDEDTGDYKNSENVIVHFAGDD